MLVRYVFYKQWGRPATFDRQAFSHRIHLVSTLHHQPLPIIFYVYKITLNEIGYTHFRCAFTLPFVGGCEVKGRRKWEWCARVVCSGFLINEGFSKRIWAPLFGAGMSDGALRNATHHLYCPHRMRIHGSGESFAVDGRAKCLVVYGSMCERLWVVVADLWAVIGHNSREIRGPFWWCVKADSLAEQRWEDWLVDAG